MYIYIYFGARQYTYMYSVLNSQFVMHIFYINILLKQKKICITYCCDTREIVMNFK